MDNKTSNSDSNSNGNSGIGHGYGYDLQRGNNSLKNTDIVGCYSVGFGCGHGRCFYKVNDNFMNFVNYDSDDTDKSSTKNQEPLKFNSFYFKCKIFF